LFWFCAGQDVPGLLADDHFAVGRNKADDQAYLTLWAAGLVPRNPNAVRVSEVRLAVVLGELLLGEHVLAVWFDLVVVAAGLVESVNDKLPFHLDGFFSFRVVEHQPTAKPAPGFLVGWMQDGVGPDGHDFGGRAGLFLFLPGHGELIFQKRTGTSAKDRRGQQYYHQAEQVVQNRFWISGSFVHGQLDLRCWKANCCCYRH